MHKITEFKADISDYLDLLLVWYRDVLLYKATWNPSSVVFSDEIMTIEKMASKSSYEGIELILHALDKAKIRLSANVNFDLTMELLLLTMKEN
jgi:DNA polymerase-3 subunit delta'